MRGWKLLLWMSLVVAWLAGCASAPSQSPSQLVATHGYVYISMPSPLYGQLTLESVKDGKRYDLLARKDEGVDGQGLWVPAGTYSLARWSAQKLSGYQEIAVQAGHVTDLGGLIRVPVGGYEFVLLPVRHPELRLVAESVVRQYAPVLATQQAIEWRNPATPRPLIEPMASSGMGLVGDLLMAYQREVNRPSMNKLLKSERDSDAFFKLARQATPPLMHEGGSDAEGKLYFGADLGQIRVRSPQGQWTSLDTGSLHQVTALAVEGPRLVAGFDDGAIRHSTDAGRSWSAVARLEPGYVVSDIDRAKTGWVVVTARMEGVGPSFRTLKGVNVLATDQDDMQGLNVIKHFDLSELTLFLPRGEVVGDSYLLNVIPDLHRLDLNTRSWKTVTPPTEVMAFDVDPASHVLSAVKIAGAFSKLYVSSNLGDSWKQYDNPSYIIQDVRFLSPTNGQAVRWSVGAFSGTFESQRYDAKKDAWTKEHEAPSGCARILPDKTDRFTFCVTTAGSILKREGAKWGPEFAVD